jgi:hypothetical protein
VRAAAAAAEAGRPWRSPGVTIQDVTDGNGRLQLLVLLLVQLLVLLQMQLLVLQRLV